MLLNVTQHPVAAMPPEERDILGLIDLMDEEPPLSRDEAFRVLEGRVFETVWPDDDFPL